MQRDQNRATVAGGISSTDGITPISLLVDPITDRLMVDAVSESLTPVSLVKCKIDQNFKTTIYGVSELDGITLVPMRTDDEGNLLASF